MFKDIKGSKLNNILSRNVLSKNTRWWQPLFNKPVFDLGESDGEELSNIFTPQYDRKLVEQFVHKQFLEGAKAHSDKYVLYDLYEYNLRQAFKKINLKANENKEWKVLDIGSVSGNTIIPLLKLIPNIKLLASEFSIPMLVTLKDSLVHHKVSESCDLLQLNAEDLDFKSNSFDLIIGGAILHHLFSPHKTIEGCFKILKKNGYAIFFEPFISGNEMLSLIFQSIIDLSYTYSLDPKLLRYLNSWMGFVHRVKGEDKTDNKFLSIDDKWLFTRSYFYKFARQYHFRKCIIYPLYQRERQFESQVKTILEIYGNFKAEIIPQWLWETVREYDRKLTEEQKESLLIEGCVIFQK